MLIVDRSGSDLVRLFGVKVALVEYKMLSLSGSDCVK
jgi:hypothetical protein